MGKKASNNVSIYRTRGCVCCSTVGLVAEANIIATFAVIATDNKEDVGCTENDYLESQRLDLGACRSSHLVFSVDVVACKAEKRTNTAVLGSKVKTSRDHPSRS
jgi:hypothetical protein